MHRDAGIYKEATAFIAFMFMLAWLDLAWLRAGTEPAVILARAGASGAVIASDVLLKEKPGLKSRRTKRVAAAVPSPKPQAIPTNDIRRELSEFFMMRGSDYPPSRVTFIAVKDEKALEVWAAGRDGVQRFIMAYPICAISGIYGPKLRRGDGQVPEGVYSITVLNPHSSYHLSMRLDYPNEFDRKMASSDGRTDLGGDIYIHGDCRSRGCIAMGDEAIEELYALIHDTGTENARVIIAPWDIRRRGHDFRLPPDLPGWAPMLYDNLAAAMGPYTDQSTGIGLAMAGSATRSN